LVVVDGLVPRLDVLGELNLREGVGAALEVVGVDVDPEHVDVFVSHQLGVPSERAAGADAHVEQVGALREALEHLLIPGGRELHQRPVIDPSAHSILTIRSDLAGEDSPRGSAALAG